MAIKFVLKQNGLRGRIQNNSLPAEYIFDGGIFTLGSDAANNIILENSAAEQAVVVREDEHLTLMNSAAGTRLNGKDLRREAIHPLGVGDEIQIGVYTILVTDTETEPQAIAPPQKKIAEEFKAGDEKITVRRENSPVEERPSSNFAAILDTLRTEEDSFYFVVKTVGEKDRHITLEKPEIPLGADERGKIVCDIMQAATVFGTVKKNWSGIVLEANRRGEIFVNDESLETGILRQLRNDDRVTFTSVAGSSLILHEPSLLVALEPLLSARTNSGSSANLAAAEQIENALPSKPHIPLFERTFFGYFSFIEILTMIIATLIGAVLFFLLFEFMFA